MLNDRGTVDSVAIIGLMVGFLVVGMIGVFIGDQMMMAVNQTTPMDSAFAQREVTVMNTFDMVVSLCKTIIIVSVATIVFVLMQTTGIIPGFSGYSEGSSYQPPTPQGRSQTVTTQPPRSQPTAPPPPVSVLPTSAPEHHNTDNRWETLEVVMPSEEK